jgi:hypothetical protein
LQEKWCLGSQGNNLQGGHWQPDKEPTIDEDFMQCCNQRVSTNNGSSKRGVLMTAIAMQEWKIAMHSQMNSMDINNRNTIARKLSINLPTDS